MTAVEPGGVPAPVGAPTETPPSMTFGTVTTSGWRVLRLMRPGTRAMPSPFATNDMTVT